MNRSREAERALVRGYVMAVTEVAREPATCDARHLRRLLSAAGITREVAVDAGADVDLEVLDQVLGTRWQQ